MNTSDRAPEDGDALAREAAHWFARMRGPDAGASRQAFEAWLAQDPEHRSAYARTAEVFAMGKLLVDADPPAPARSRRPILVGTLAAALVGAAGIGGWAVTHPGAPVQDQHSAVVAATDRRTIATVAGETRVVRLADGSTLRLGDGTMIEVAIGSDRRNLRLLRGRARFEVAHEMRPFVVFAGGGSVTARGTIFEVALAKSGKVDVRLFQGAVDVALPRQSVVSQPVVRKLAAGESVSFSGQQDAAPRPSAPSGAAVPDAADTAREFEATPVAELIALANRGTARPIRLADPALGAKRVSGRFRIDDTELLARRLAALFGIVADLGDPHEITLTSPGGAPVAGTGASASR